MKFFTTASVLVGGLASLVATDIVSDTSDYFYGLDATDIAPVSCTSASEYFSCYRTISAYDNCAFTDDSCFCSSVSIDESCHTKYCPNITYDSYDITRWCNGSATPVSSPAKTTSAPSITTNHSSSSSSAGKSSSSSSSAAAAASATGASASSAKPAAQASDSSAQATSTASSTAAAAAGSSSPNAGGRSVVVSVGGVVVAAVASLAVAGAFA